MKQVIIKQLQNLLDGEQTQGLNRKVSGLRKEFRALVEERKQQHRQKFLNEDGDLADYKGFKDPLDQQFYGLIDSANEKIELEQKELKKRQKELLEGKKVIIAELKTMVDEVAPADMNKGFELLKEIENKWKKSGNVSGEESDDLYFKYKHQRDRFYDIVRINNEMRDVDFAKNLEVKQEVISQMEALKASGQPATSPEVVKELKKLNMEWRNSGGIDRDLRDSTYGQHRALNEYFGVQLEGFYQDKRKNAGENLVAKIALCDKVNEINAMELTSPKAWNEQTQAVLDIQKEWKTVGYSDENETVWEAFRQCVDKFFNGKREFFDSLDGMREENAIKKAKLVEEAESRMDSDDWKNTTDFYINLQKQWKATGPGPREKDNELWDKFRAACDKFFNAKNEFYSNKDEIYDENLVKKEALIADIEALQLTGNTQEDFLSIRKFFNDWNAIGFVPMDKKDELYKRYREACDAKFDQLNTNKDEQRKMRVEAELEDIMNSDNAEFLLQRKKDNLRNDIDQLSNEIAQIENNMGFFRGNTNMLSDYANQINNKKQRRADLERELRDMPISPMAENAVAEGESGEEDSVEA